MDDRFATVVVRPERVRRRCGSRPPSWPPPAAKRSWPRRPPAGSWRPACRRLATACRRAVCSRDSSRAWRRWRTAVCSAAGRGSASRRGGRRGRAAARRAAPGRAGGAGPAGRRRDARSDGGPRPVGGRRGAPGAARPDAAVGRRGRREQRLRAAGADRRDGRGRVRDARRRLRGRRRAVPHRADEPGGDRGAGARVERRSAGPGDGARARGAGPRRSRLPCASCVRANAGIVDPRSRALVLRFEVDNPDGRLLVGQAGTALLFTRETA